MPEQDVYRSCPCESGKKLKFCCLSKIDELTKIRELIARNRTHDALSLAEEVLRKGVESKDAASGLRLTMIDCLLRLDEIPFNQRMGLVDLILKQCKQDTPEHPAVSALEIIAECTRSQSVDCPAIVKRVAKTRQLTNGGETKWIPSLLEVVSRTLGSNGYPFASIAHFNLVQLSNPSRGLAGGAFQKPIDISDPTLLYPVTEPLTLRLIKDLGSLQAQFDTAVDLWKKGHFNDAIRAFGLLARERPTDSRIWWNIGISHINAAENPLAVKALTVAASHDPDPESATETLAIVQLLATNGATSSDAGIPCTTQGFSFGSIRRLHRILESSPRFALLERSPTSEESNESDPPEMAAFCVLPESKADLQGGKRFYPLAHVRIFAENRDAKQRGILFIKADGKIEFEKAVAALNEVAGGELTAMMEPKVSHYVTAEFLLFTRACGQLTEAGKVDWSSSSQINEIRLNEWLETPQAILKNKSPMAAKGDPELEMPLRVGVLLAHLFTTRTDAPLDEDSIRERLGLPRLARLSGSDLEQLGYLPPSLRYRRVDLSTLSIDQLREFIKLTEYSGSKLRFEALRLFLLHPNAFGNVDESSDMVLSFNQLSSYASSEVILEVYRVVSQRARECRLPLTICIAWDVNYAQSLLFFGSKDEGQQILNRLWEFDVPKLPEMRPQLVDLFTKIGVDGPWMNEKVESEATEVATK